MQFTYEAYEGLISSLRSNGYEVATYHDYKNYQKPVIMRHDVDYSLEKSLEMAKIEEKMGVRSTYFVLLTSDFYNIFSKNSQAMVKEIHRLGHNVGLHFDEVRYREPEIAESGIINLIKKEANILSDSLGINIKSVSMHRPSKKTLRSDLQISGLINSYGKEFFNDFKYVSDSRMRWGENIINIIESSEYDKLHILTHAFWYSNKEEDINAVINQFIKEAEKERIDSLRENITDLDSILKR